MNWYFFGDIQQPTNDAGLVTLFSQRPFVYCLKHDIEITDGMLMICDACDNEDYTRRQASERNRRIAELREAIRPLFDAAIAREQKNG